MDASVVAYSAGFFDGEGCVSISYCKSRNAYRLQVSVTQVDPAPIEFFRKHWGGNVWHQKSKSPNRSDSYEWLITGRVLVAAFLDAVRPYCLVKGAEMDVALEYLESCRNSPWACRGRPVDPREQKRREGFKRRLHALKTKGTKPQGDVPKKAIAYDS